MSLIKLPEPDAGVIARRDVIVKDLERLVGAEVIISDEDGRRAYDTDALTAYTRMPLAVALPRTTEEVAAILRYCRENGVKVVARGAGTSLCGGALPAEDAIVVTVSKMNRVLEIDYANRLVRVQAGITNLAISGAVAKDGFFYAPDPSSQLACTLAGNLAMNSGGAHCLKYGVTTNNVLGLTMVLMSGETVEIGGAHLDSEGYDLLGLIVGSEGQFGIITEATVRILKAAEGARPMLLGFGSSEAAGRCVSAIIASGIIPVAIEFMDKPAIEVCEAFAKAGYPTNVDALLIIEGKVSRDDYSGGVRVTAERIYDLDGARTRFAQSLRLLCNGQCHASPSASSKLNLLLSPYRLEEGGCPVWIEYRNPVASCEVRLGGDWRVKLDARLLESLQDWLAPEAVRIIY